MNIETSGINANAPSQQSSASSRQLPDSASANTAAPVPTVNAATNTVQQAQQAEKPEVSPEKLQAAVEKMNELMQSGNRSLRFSVDDTADRVVVKVMDLETEEVVRQIPTEETLKFSEFLEGMVGLIFDERA
ncbi:flagellar protein FlaG [Marinobacterium sp. MBR-109]|jgi:flagellar protein FlaG|uniref:flagellar protein FlaG n=1 Tax=Marinobacterium sp. MBR-109 TaxID=3156462 RepID=UPI003398EC95